MNGTRKGLLHALAALALAAGARAASHSDAPLIKQDPQANITDVWIAPRSAKLAACRACARATNR